MSDIAPEAVQSSPEDRLVALLGGGPKQEPATPAPVEQVAQDADADAEVPEAAGVDSAAQEDEQAEQLAGEPDEPFEELEHLGKTYEVPVSLKKAFDENRALATRASETAKHAEALLQHVNAQAQLAQAEVQFKQYAEPELREETRLLAIADQYKAALRTPGLERSLRDDYRDQLEATNFALEEVKKQLGSKREQYDNWRSQQQNEALAKGREYLSKAIRNFDNEAVRTDIARTGLALGYSQKEIETLSDPRLVVALHKAAQWDRLQAQKPAAQNKIAKAPAVVKPGASTSQNTSTAVREKALRARLKQTGNVNDAAALLMTRMR